MGSKNYYPQKRKTHCCFFWKNTELIARTKVVDGSWWSATLGVWHVPDTEENRVRFKIIPVSYILDSTEGIEQIEKFKTMDAIQTLKQKHDYYL